MSLEHPWSVAGTWFQTLTKALTGMWSHNEAPMEKPQEFFNFNDGLMAGRAEFQARDRVFFRLLPQVQRETLQLPFPTTLGCFKLGWSWEMCSMCVVFPGGKICYSSTTAHQVSSQSHQAVAGENWGNCAKRSVAVLQELLLPGSLNS